MCNNKDSERVIKIKRLILLFSVFIISIVFGAKFIINTWISKYNDSVIVMILLFAAQYVSIIIRCMHVNLYKAEKKQNRYFVIMVLIVVLSIILNVVLYNMNKSIESIAFATLITNIIWFIVGEIDFKEYRLKIKDYTYMIILLVVFIICGILVNSILGFIIYIIIAILLSMILLRETFIYCFNQVSIYAKKTLKKLKGAN